MQIAAEVYHNLKVVITEKYGLAGVYSILSSHPESAPHKQLTRGSLGQAPVLAMKGVSRRPSRRQKRLCSCWWKLRAVLDTQMQ